jgi:phosphatidylglycerol:prolipoprotein diacylglycerol transferase
MAIAEVGAFLAGRSLGAVTEVPWAVTLFGVRRHPVAIYEALAVLILLAIVLRLDQRGEHRPGWLALVTLFSYAAIRLFLEPLRAAGVTVGDGWRLVQVVALVTLAICGWLLGRLVGGNSSTHQEKTESQSTPSP